MRDSLTVLAILLIVLLTAALVGPYFIDWNSHRALIEAKLSQAAGAPVSIGGRIVVRLLPQPIFKLAQVTVGATRPGEQGLTADEVDVEIGLTALMRGEVQVVDARLRSPRLDISTAANGAVHLPIRAIADPERFQFQHFGITDGALTLAVAGRDPVTVSGIDLDGEATSLLGPFKASGRFGPADAQHPFHVSTGTFGGGKLRIKLGLDGSRTRPAIDIDGFVLPGGEDPPAGLPQTKNSRAGGAKIRAAQVATNAPRGPAFDGAVTVSGDVPLSETPATIPWRLVGHVAADSDKATVTDLELRAGTDMRALIATGTGEAGLGARPVARLKLHGPQINLDTLAVAAEKSTLAPPRGFDVLRHLNALAVDPQWLGGLAIGLDLDYGFDTATAGDRTILDIGGHLTLDGEKPAALRFAASGPDGARVAFDGTFEPGPAPVFRGHVEAALRNLPRFADWLEPAWPGTAAWVARTVPVQTFGFSGTADLSGVGIAARDATLTLDRTTLAGTLSYTRAVGADRARIFADLSSDALDLDTLPDLGGSNVDWGDLDMKVALSARAVTVAPAGIGAVDAGRLALRLSKDGDSVRLDEFSAELGNARLNATASLVEGNAQTQIHVDAPQLDAVANLLDRLLPSGATALLKARAAALSPAALDIHAEGAVAGDGSLLPTTLSLDGMVDGTRLAARLRPDRPGDLDPATAVVSVDVTAGASEAATLMRQLGVPLPAETKAPVSIGPGKIEAKAHGSVAAGFDTRLTAHLGTSDLSFDGKAKPGLGSGHLDLKAADLAPLLRTLGLVPPGDETVPAEAAADLSWHDSNVALRRLAGRVAEVGFTGDLNADLMAPPASRATKPALFGTLSLDRLPAASLLALAFGAPTQPSAAATSSQELTSWSDKPFGPAVLRLPRTELSMKIGVLALGAALEARNASLTLRGENGAITLANLTGSAGGGSLSGTLTLRRDGPAASLNGLASWSNQAIDISGMAGRCSGSFDLAGTGNSVAALVGSLAGTGSITLTAAHIARFDPAAVARTAEASEKNTSEVDAEQVRRMLLAELDHGPLPLGNIGGPGTLAAGVLRTGVLRVDGGPWSADTETALDLKSLSVASHTTIKVRQPLADWKSDPPQVTLNLHGPLAAPLRDVDAVAFVNALQSRAIARDQERIDVMQQDIRERAYFNRRLKAIEADQQAARDKAKAEAEALQARAQAEADAAQAKAKAEADAAQAKAKAEADAARDKAKADAEAAQAKAKAAVEAAREKAKSDAEAAQARAKAAAEARAAAIERQLTQDTVKSLDIATPKARAAPGASAAPRPPPRPTLLPGIRLPTIGAGEGTRAKPLNIKPPSIIQDGSSSGSVADPGSEGRY